MDTFRENEPVITNWLQDNAIPIQHLEAGNGFTNLQPLKHIFDDVRIVGLGEATHGTHEFFQLKHRLLEFLVTEMGFTMFAVESSYAACQPINEYVLHDNGDRDAVLVGQHYVAWDTEEFSALLDWLRAYNRNVPDDRKVRFYGLDITYNENGRQAVLEYLNQVDPDKVGPTASLFQVLAREEAKWPMRIDKESEATTKRTVPLLQDLIAYMTEHRDTLVGRSSRAAFERTLRFVQIMEQWGSSGNAGRSQHMAGNLLHLIDRDSTGTKAVYWGHNFHVGVEASPDGGQTFGHVLRQRFGDAYFALALEFGQGSFQTRAVQPDGVMGDLKEETLGPPLAGSLPWHLSRAGIDAFVVSLRTPTSDPIIEQWLAATLAAHAIGWASGDPASAYEPRAIGTAYDGIAFVQQATATRPTATALKIVERRKEF